MDNRNLKLKVIEALLTWIMNIFEYEGIYREYTPEFRVTRVLRRIGVILKK